MAYLRLPRNGLAHTELKLEDVAQNCQCIAYKQQVFHHVPADWQGAGALRVCR